MVACSGKIHMLNIHPVLQVKELYMYFGIQTYKCTIWILKNEVSKLN
jgi:hypothetical protein